MVTYHLNRYMSKVLVQLLGSSYESSTATILLVNSRVLNEEILSLIFTDEVVCLQLVKNYLCIYNNVDG